MVAASLLWAHSMDIPLWPARDIAEFAYCPRLFYYMEIRAFTSCSADTEEGQRITDMTRPSQARAKVEPDGEAPQTVRSLR